MVSAIVGITIEIIADINIIDLQCSLSLSPLMALPMRKNSQSRYRRACTRRCYDRFAGYLFAQRVDGSGITK